MSAFVPRRSNRAALVALCVPVLLLPWAARAVQLATNGTIGKVIPPGGQVSAPQAAATAASAPKQAASQSAPARR